MNYFCCDELRRAALQGTALNGIDFLEVLDHDAPTEAERQRKLFVHFVNPLAGAPLSESNISIEGGERIRNIAVTNVTAGVGPNANVLTVEVDQPGDYSVYTLRLVQDPQHSEPPDGYDPALSAVEFSFKVECPSDFDCLQPRVCPPTPRAEPEINYLAKDYSTFRRLLLDRLGVLMPQRVETSPADFAVAMIELLAYVGDYLSYQQDAIATEAYLGTARCRVSVRRHARLVDYLMHDGCNARAWIHLHVSADAGPLPKGTAFFTRIEGQPVLVPNDPAVLGQAAVAFETMYDVPMLYAAHNELPFHTWSDQRCCLPKGSTSATLKGHFPHLKAGDVLLFEEVLGPRTGLAEDADPAHRHAVRLTKVVAFDSSNNALTDPLTTSQITAVEWAADDALPFPLCISARTDEDHGEQYIENVSVARGNMVLADHGLTRTEPLLPDTVPAPALFRPPATDDPCVVSEPEAVPPRYRPQLAKSPLTQAAPFDPSRSATAAMTWKVEEALPAISLASQHNSDTDTWVARRDMLNSAPDLAEFVVEVERDGAARLRFGDDLLGKRPETGTQFTATYRVGNGTGGNVGAETLVHILANLPQIEQVRNPLPAQGGAEPESIEDVRQRAPSAFRRQERAVTPDDYAEVTERHPDVQRAAATFRWTGSWHTVFVTVDREAGRLVDAPFRAEIRDHVERYRMAGYDLEVDAPRFAPLEIEMHVCVKPDYFRSDVRAALLEVFSNRTLPDGRRGVFHPDNFTFGQTVYLSPLYLVAQAIPGVASAEIKVFQRQGNDDPKPLQDGKLELGRLEIARLDNDPNFQEHGVFRLTLGGGK
ncbi:MAG: putative baseplate assembly protein [Terriglobia bacterium]